MLLAVYCCKHAAMVRLVDAASCSLVAACVFRMQISFAAHSCSNLAALSCSNLAALSCGNLVALSSSNLAALSCSNLAAHCLQLVCGSLYVESV